MAELKSWYQKFGKGDY